MSLKRILGFTISLLDLIIIAAIAIMPYGVNASTGVYESLLSVSKAPAIVLIVFSAIGFLFGILGKKVEINYANIGASLFYTLSVFVSTIMSGTLTSLFQNAGLGYHVIFVASIFGFAGTVIYAFSKDSNETSKPKVSVVGNTQNSGMQQRTNSLNMNMPVNNYQALPVTVQEKQKAPMDILLRGKDAPPPMGSTVVQGNTVQSHMTELGLKSINISQDNLTGAVQTQPSNEPQLQQIPPMNQNMPVPGGPALEQTMQMPGVAPQMGQPMPGQMMGEAPMPGIPSVAPMTIGQAPGQPPLVEQNVPGGVPNNQMPPAPQGPVPMPKPDLLAGSAMSGQMDTSPYNSGPIQPGQGQFF